MKMPKMLAMATVLATCAGSPILAEGSPELVPLGHVILTGERGGEVAYFHQRGEDDEPPGSVAVVEAAGGAQARLSARFEPRSGIATQRLEDLGTGWSAQWRLATGLRNLAEVGSIGTGTTSEWLQHAEERRRHESPGETYVLETADGAFVTWFEPAGEETAAAGTGEPSEAQVRALAELALQLQEAPPPPSALAVIGLLGRLLSGTGDGHLDDYEALIRSLRETLLVAGLEVSASADGDDADIERLPVAEETDRIDALRQRPQDRQATNPEDSG